MNDTNKTVELDTEERVIIYTLLRAEKSRMIEAMDKRPSILNEEEFKVFDRAYFDKVDNLIQRLS